MKKTKIDEHERLVQKEKLIKELELIINNNEAKIQQHQLLIDKHEKKIDEYKADSKSALKKIGYLKIGQSKEEIQIGKLAESYGMIINSGAIYGMVFGVPAYEYINHLHKQDEEIVHLIRFLACCEGKSIKLSGEVTNPTPQLKKGWKQEFELKNQDIILTLMMALVKDLNLVDLQKEDKSLEVAEVMEHILENLYEEEEPLPTLTPNATIGKTLFDWFCCLEQYDAYGNCTLRKKYSFLYDCLVILENTQPKGEGYKGEIGREKAEYVRNHINSYKKALSK